MSPVTPPGVGAILYSAGQIASAVAGLARRIVADLPGEPILLVGVLKGALFLTSDLARALPPASDPRIDFLMLASYSRDGRSSGEVRLLKDTSESVEGKHVVILEGIVDTGLSLQFAERLLTPRKPASLRSCALLEKPYRRAVDVTPDYVGMTCPDAFVVGYGLDYQEKYRNLPYLAKLDSRAFEG